MPVPEKSAIDHAVPPAGVSLRIMLLPVSAKNIAVTTPLELVNAASPRGPLIITWVASLPGGEYPAVPFPAIKTDWPALGPSTYTIRIRELSVSAMNTALFEPPGSFPVAMLVGSAHFAVLGLPS